MRDIFKGTCQAFSSPYWCSLYEQGRVIPAKLDMNIESGDFKERLAGALTAMSEYEGPYLIHCMEGKDRTGIALILLEMLSGASLDELEEDFMLTYENYYGITQETEPEKYQIILEYHFVPMVESITGPTESVGAAGTNTGMRIGFGSVWGAGNKEGSNADADADEDADAIAELTALTRLSAAELEAYADRYMLKYGADKAQLDKLKQCLTGEVN